MSLIAAASLAGAKLSGSALVIMTQVQLARTDMSVQAAPCYQSRNDFANAFKPLLNWAFGNVRGIAPWIAAGVVLVIGLIILVKVLGRDDVSTWVKAVGWVFVGLAIVLFVPTVIFTIADTAPSGC
jgi:hypothetical protein